MIKLGISLLAFSTAFTALAVASGEARADDKKAREIMEKFRYRDDGDNGSSDVTMILIDGKGKEQVRKLRVLEKDRGRDEYQIMFFLDPPDLKNTGFLTLDYDAADKDDDQWLYLPALRKTKRIASTDKSSSFLGSDLTFADLATINLTDYDYKLARTAEVDGNKVWIIESTPRGQKVIDRTGVKKSVIMIRQDNYLKIREVQWMKTGETKYWEAGKIETVSGIPVATEMVMATKKNDKLVHKTVLRISNIKFNQKFNDDLFTASRLEKGL